MHACPSSGTYTELLIVDGLAPASLVSSSPGGTMSLPDEATSQSVIRDRVILLNRLPELLKYYEDGQQ